MIDKRPGRCGGMACIAGTRLYVALFVALRAEGYDDYRILTLYPYITREQLAAAFTYAEQNAEEIAADLRSMLGEDEPEPMAKARALYIHDLTADLRTLVDRYELAVSHPRVPPSDTATRELGHARAALANAEQLRGLRFDRVMAGEEKL